MKILLVGDYSNFHPTLARALAAMGHDVTVASDGCRWMDTERAIDLSRPLKGPLGGALLFTRLLLGRPLRGYDVVSIINPSFVTLRPSRLRYLFDDMRRHNGAVFLNACGTDKAMVDMLLSPDCPLRYSEYTPEVNKAVVEADRRWQQGAIADFCEYVYDHVDGVTTALYEYDLAMRRRLPAERVTYTGIPIDTDRFAPLDRQLAADDRVALFLGRHRDRMALKGTDRLGRIAMAVADENPRHCSLEIVENVPFDDYCRRQLAADVVIDQLYSYTPATNALMAMARGQAVVSGAEPEYYDFIGEKTHPIANVEPDDDMIYAMLTDLVLQPDLVRAMGHESRAFVERHNSAPVVARRFLQAWEKAL